MTASYTYLATKIHPTEGLLLKVGRSASPLERCRMLAARPFCDPLPHRCERELLAMLRPWRVWPTKSSRTMPLPVFAGQREWHYVTEELIPFLEAYAALVRSLDVDGREAAEVAADQGYNPRQGPRTLRDVRLAGRLSIRDLETLTGINRAILSQVERGRLVPNGTKLAVIAEALELPVERTLVVRPLVCEEAAA